MSVHLICTGVLNMDEPVDRGPEEIHEVILEETLGPSAQNEKLMEVDPEPAQG